MKKLSFIVFVIFAFILLFTSETFACACCAEKGEYSISTQTPDKYKLDLLSAMKFDGATELYTTAAGFDDVKGLNAIKASYDSNNWETTPNFFTLENMFAAKTFKFNFKAADGKTGTLVLPLPSQMLNFKADIHDTTEGSEVSLYKEWRFKGTVGSGNGFFKSSILKPTTYFLVLQGRGNNCDNAEDFNHWRLEITGKNANYAFFGKMN
jgi:hypothetical protein